MNATGKQGRRYDDEELLALSKEAAQKGLPPWVSQGLVRQVNVGKSDTETA